MAASDGRARTVGLHTEEIRRWRDGSRNVLFSLGKKKKKILGKSIVYSLEKNLLF